MMPYFRAESLDMLSTIAGAIPLVTCLGAVVPAHASRFPSVLGMSNCSSGFRLPLKRIDPPLVFVFKTLKAIAHLYR